MPENTTGQDKIYSMITERICGLLESGTVPWQKPWAGSDSLPSNMVSKKPYRGVNVFLLHAAGYSSSKWLSYKQALELGGQVRKGEKGWPVIFWKTFKRKDKDGVESLGFVLRYYTVFNASQCDGLPIEPEKASKPAVEPIAACEAIVANMPKRPDIKHNEPQAYYRPSDDFVNMPEKGLFMDSHGYYSTLFHELTHSTGHKSRLNRKTLADLCRFGDTNYSKEELVAEMGAAFLCGVAGIVNATVTNSAAYLKHWLERLKEDPKLIVQASAQAQKAADYILAIKHGDDG